MIGKVGVVPNWVLGFQHPQQQLGVFGFQIVKDVSILPQRVMLTLILARSCQNQIVPIVQVVQIFVA